MHSFWHFFIHNKKATCVVPFCVYFTAFRSYRRYSYNIELPIHGSWLRGGALDSRALLWSLVSPRDLTKSPDRFRGQG
jgi:hypothetical protein